MFVGLAVKVGVGGTSVFVGLAVKVGVGGTDVSVGVAVKVAVGGTGVFVGVDVYVEVGVGPVHCNAGAVKVIVRTPIGNLFQETVTVWGTISSVTTKSCAVKGRIFPTPVCTPPSSVQR